VPLPNTFDIEMPAPGVPPEIARFYGAWIGTWQDDRHILVVERVTSDGHANVVFAYTGQFAAIGNRRFDILDGLCDVCERRPLYGEALIREYYQAFTAAGGVARFELLHGVPDNSHLLRLHPDRWRPVEDQFLATLDLQRR
jgi:hypothetical protein